MANKLSESDKLLNRLSKLKLKQYKATDFKEYMISDDDPGNAKKKILKFMDSMLQFMKNGKIGSYAVPFIFRKDGYIKRKLQIYLRLKGNCLDAATN